MIQIKLSFLHCLAFTLCPISLHLHIPPKRYKPSSRKHWNDYRLFLKFQGQQQHTGSVQHVHHSGTAARGLDSSPSLQSSHGQPPASQGNCSNLSASSYQVLTHFPDVSLYIPLVSSLILDLPSQVAEAHSHIESYSPLLCLFFFFKVFIYLFSLAVLGLRCGARASLVVVPWPGMEAASPALEGGFLTTAPPGKSLHLFVFKNLSLRTVQYTDPPSKGLAVKKPDKGWREGVERGSLHIPFFFFLI